LSEGTLTVAGAGNRRHRREQVTSEERQQRLIYMGAGGLIVLVLLIVAVGVLLTVVLPPRSTVLTVGDQTFNARAVSDRAIYLVSSGNGNAQQNPAEEAMNSLIGQSILFQVGAGMVAEVTDQEVQDAIAQRLGLAARPSADAATPEATTEAAPDGTAEATAEASPAVEETPTPEPTPAGYTDAEYATALADYLRTVEISRRALEDIVRAGIIEDRLVELFKSELPEAGDQLQLWAIPTDNRAAAQRLIDLVRGGMEFREAAVEAGIAESVDQGVQDLGWFAPTSLNDRVSPFVLDLQAGEVSDPVEDARRVGFEVYYVVERSSDLPYEENVRAQLARRAFNQWKDAQEEALLVKRDLSDRADNWIRNQMRDFLRG